MKILSVFHPLFQVATFVVGVYNARMGITRKNFTYRRHFRFGMLYYGMAVLGLSGGMMITESLEEAGHEIELGSHLEIAFLMVFLFVLAGVLGLLVHYRPNLRKGLMPVHKYLNLATLLLFIYQAVTGFSGLLRFLLS